MSGFQRIAGLVVLTGLVTTLVYPTHKTAPVLDSLTKLITRTEHTVITGAA